MGLDLWNSLLIRLMHFPSFILDFVLHALDVFHLAFDFLYHMFAVGEQILWLYMHGCFLLFVGVLRSDLAVDQLEALNLFDSVSRLLLGEVGVL